MTEELFKDRLARLRVARRLSLQEIADCCGVRRQSVSAWLSGRHAPRNEHYAVLAAVCGVSVEYLITGHDADVSQLGVLADIYQKLQWCNPRQLQALLGVVNECLLVDGRTGTG